MTVRQDLIFQLQSNVFLFRNIFATFLLFVTAVAVSSCFGGDQCDQMLELKLAQIL